MFEKIMCVVLFGMICFSLIGCLANNSSVKIIDFMWEADTYMDNAIEIDIEVENIGETTVSSYLVVTELYDSNGKYLTTFTSKSTNDLAAGESSEGDIHLELKGINASQVKDVKVSIEDVVTQ